MLSLPRFCSCLTILQHCRAQRSWEEGRQPRGQGRIIANSCTAPSALWKLHSHICWGTGALMGPSLSTKGPWPVLVPPPGQLAHVGAWHVTLQKDATDEWCNRKKQKPTKAPPGILIARWSTMQMQHEKNTGKSLQGSAFRPWIGSLTLSLMLPGPPACPKARRGSEEPDPGCNKKKPQTSLPSRNAKKGEGYI